MKRIIYTFFLLLLIISITLLGFLVSKKPAITNATSHLQISLPNCFLTAIHLNGDNPATTNCLVAGKSIDGTLVPYVNGKIVPPTGIADCNYPGSNINAEIYTISQGWYCFTGTGYIGFPSYKHLKVSPVTVTIEPGLCTTKEAQD